MANNCQATPAEELHECQLSKKLKLNYFDLRGYHSSKKGERDEMEDAYQIIDDLLSSFISAPKSIGRLAYFAVFDGHGGRNAAMFSASHLHKKLISNFPSGDLNDIEKDLKLCLIETFKKTDQDFLKFAASQKPIYKDGTTANVILVIENTAYISNVGDSKSVLCRKKNDKFVAISLNKEHNPSEYTERQRIQKAGGFVKNGRVDGVLEVSRSIGDGQYKTHGVTCLPDVKRCILSEHDQFIIMACDGLWKSIEPQEAVDIVLDVLEQPGNEVKCLEHDETVIDAKFRVACGKLSAEAVKRLSADNVTVLLINISNNDVV